jgi:hypothetical protein
MIAPAPAVSPALWPEYMSQKTAAAYLDIDARTFRRSVDVEAVLVASPKPGMRPLRRWRRVDLDQWVQRCTTGRLHSRKGVAA